MSNPVRARLVADTDVSAEVSQRVYAHMLPQGSALPASTLLHVSSIPENSMGGGMGARNQRWQVDVWTKGYLASESLADKVEAAMAATGSDFNALLLDRGNGFEDDTALYRVTLDFSVRIK